jgi:DnaJ-class molecular chaperone
MDQGANMNDIFKIAQQVASQITPPPEMNGKNFDPSTVDMGKMIAQVTQSVTQIVTPEFIDKMSTKDTQLSPKEKAAKPSKITFEELSDNDDCDPIMPRTKDLNFTMDVTLEDLYNGKKKKLAVRRKKITSDGSISEEKKKIQVNIQKGMIDGQVIRFNKMADEKKGYDTGDIVITLSLGEHETFERDGNNLIVEKEISLFESYSPTIYINHLDERVLEVSGDRMDLFGEDFDTFKKLTGEGMPTYGEVGKFGDLFIRFKCVLPSSFTTEQLCTLESLFPRVNIVPTDVETVKKSVELVTESDLEFLEESDDSESSEYESEELESD